MIWAYSELKNCYAVSERRIVLKVRPAAIAPVASNCRYHATKFPIAATSSVPKLDL